MKLPFYIKNAILAHRSTGSTEQALGLCIDTLCRDERYDLVVQVLDRAMGLTYGSSPMWHAVRDFALLECASER